MSPSQLQQNIFLIGDVDAQISGNKLPSNMQVFKTLFFNIRILKLSVQKSASLVVQEVSVFWEKARIPTRATHHCVQQLIDMYDKWRNLQKNAGKDSNTEKEIAFSSKLKQLFDIAHQDAMNQIDDRGRTFLSNQRTDERSGYIADVETPYDIEENSRLQRAAIEKERLQKQKQREGNQGEFLQWESSCSNLTLSQPAAGSSFHPDEYTSWLSQNKGRGTINFMTEKVAVALDKCKVTDRNAVHLIIAIAQALNHDVSCLVINRSSIRNSRREFREERARNIKEIFKATRLDSIVLHCDGKLMPNLPKHVTAERLPVVISNGMDTEQILGIPELENGGGLTQASAIFELLVDWNLCDKIKALCCDTTNSNLGSRGGAAVLLEHLLERELLYFPCRHHIFELVLKGTFMTKILGMSGPDVPLFRRFQKSWKTFNQNNYKVGMENNELKPVLTDYAQSIHSFIEKIKNQQPRDDYKEFLDLVQIFIGKVPAEQVKFRYPGAYHHARWIAKANYCLKIYLFREEFELKAKEERDLAQVCLFVVIIYMQAWFTCPLSPQAPNHDLQFLKKVINYRSIDSEISTAAFDKIKNHLWYLNPRTAAMAFFDEGLSVEIKRKMVAKLVVIDDLKEINFRKFQSGLATVDDLLDKEIDFFINSSSLEFFVRFGIDREFLEVDPSMWSKDANFQKGLAIVKNLRVVNDTAERAVNLVQNYNNLMTTDEDQKLYMLQVIKEYSKQFPNLSKGTVTMDFQ